MRFSRFLVLDALVREDRLLRGWELADIVGVRCTGSASVMITEMVRCGVIYRPYAGTYGLTERGRVAHALQSAINTRAARRGYQ